MDVMVLSGLLLTKMVIHFKERDGVSQDVRVFEAVAQQKIASKM